MKELLQSIFKTTEERVKNPLINAFITSWIVFNWKPIVFFIFSDRIIEEKINYISLHFSNSKYLFWFPLSAAVFYVLLIPYLSLLFELLLKTSLLKRNVILINRKKQSIDNEKQIAIEEIKLEEAKTEFRERKTHNKLVEELQVQNKNLESEITTLKESNRITIEELKNEHSNRDKLTNEELRIFQKRYSESRREIKNLNELLFERDKEIQDLKMIVNNRGLYGIESKDNKTNNVVIIQFENGTRILEAFDGNKLVYRNLETNETYTSDEVKELTKRFSHKRYIQ